MSIAESSRKKSVFKNLVALLKKKQTPSWISLDPQKLEGTIKCSVQQKAEAKSTQEVR